MKTLRALVLTGTLGGLMLLLAAGAVGAQSKTFEGDSVTKKVTIEEIEQSSRMITVKDDKGIYETIDVPREITRFPEFKVGDTITVRYYQNVVIRIKQPGEAAVDVDAVALTRGAGATPAGTAAMQRTITVTVTAKDPKTSAVTVKGPNGYVYSRRATDKKAFERLKVGDQLDMTWTDALLIAVVPPK